MADIAMAIVNKIIELLVEPILLRPLSPIFCFETIVEDFFKERRQLTHEKNRVKNSVQDATNNGRQVYEHVEEWVKEVEAVMVDVDNLVEEWVKEVGAVMVDVDNLVEELTNNKSCCFNTGWTYHYSFSKKVQKNTGLIKNLCDRGKLIQEVGPPFDIRQHIGLHFLEDFVSIKSADEACSAVMGKLKKDNINKVLLYGMRGSGKTTLAKQVVEEAQRCKIVERAFIVGFPQTREEDAIGRIQVAIADLLNVKLEQESIEGRKARLYRRLTNGEKVLIILDDVCKAFHLDDIGIPASGGCKVLFTTHDLQVRNSMQAHEDNIITLGALSEDEGWDLFKSVVGVSDFLRKHDVTKEVLQPCEGLPKVIVNVGRALRGKEPSQWEETLQQLKNDQFKNISAALRTEMEKLRLQQERVKNQVEIAKNNAQVIEKDVEKWLADVESIAKEAEQWESKMNQSISCFSHCDTLINQNQELITRANKLLENSIFVQVGHPTPIRQYMGLSSTEDFMVSDSTRSAFHHVMDALEKDGVNMIGLHGMGGIGKTTLAKYVCEEAKRSKIFNDVVLVTVSQTPDILKIQGEIADFLNLELKQESERGRAGKLNQRLEREKILIILDDVWEKFDLAKIGIFGDECKGCKILLTTRRLQVCTSMGCQPKFKLDLLSEAEAWEFFRKKAHLPNDSKSNKVAKEIVGECGGLFIALATVGSALREKGINDLEQALKKLREFRLDEIPEVDRVDGEDAYKCLRVSYDYLKSGEAQFLLLLCSLFPEDHEISMEDLTRCAYGMRLFKRADSVQDARGEVGVAVQCLIDSCLLLGTGKKGIVKIHDVVRDVALWIGGTESPEGSVFVVRDEKDMRYRIQNESFKNCRAISFMPNSISEIPNYELDCSKLEIMLIFSGSRALDLSDASFFKNTTALKVLDVRGHGIKEMCDFPVPQSLQDLKDLRTVNIRWCRCSNSSFLGKLKNLEILSVIDSEVDCAIEAVFTEMKKLKLLDLSRPSSNVKKATLSSNVKKAKATLSSNVKKATLSSNVIRELSNLKELYTYPGYSFGGCKSSDDGERIESSNIVEVNWIRNLVRLSAHIVGWGYLPTDFCFRDDLECYSMIVGPNEKLELEHDRVLCLDGMEERSQLQAFKNLFPSVEYLQLRNLRLEEGFENIIPCWVNALVASESFLQNLRRLKVSNSNELEVSNSNELQVSNSNELEVSNSNELEVLFELKYICKEPTTLFPCNLTHVIICNCQKLKTIFSSPLCIAPSLQQLQVLYIQSCHQLEEVISASADSNDNFSTCFQNLRELKVYSCSNLKVMFHILGFPLPKLQQIYLHGNGKLEHVFDPQTEKRVAATEQWPSLELLSVSRCPKLSSDFIADIQTQLQAPSKAKQLRTIKLGNMKGIEKIILPQNRDDDDELLTFHLKKLELDNLQDLTCVWSHAKHNICFSYLTQVKVRNCNKLKKLFMITIAPSLEQLKRLEVLDCKELVKITSIDNQVPEENVSDDHTNMISITFPKLTALKLKGLPSLIEFCPANYNLVFPSLTKSNLQLEGCPQSITDLFSSQRVALKGKKKPQIK